MNYFVVWHERVKMTGGVQGLKENCSIHGTMEQAEEAYAEVHEAMLSERGKMPLVPLNTEGAVNDIHILVPVKSTLYKTLGRVEGLEGDTLLYSVLENKKGVE